MKRMKREPLPQTPKAESSTSIAYFEAQYAKVQPQCIPSRFTNGAQYENFFFTLMKLESDFLKNSKDCSTKQSAIKFLRWEDLPTNKVCANFKMECNKTVWNPALGETLILRRLDNDTNWTGYGRVIKVPQNRLQEEMILELDSSDIPRDHTTGFLVTEGWISKAYEKQASALHKFASDCSNNKNFIYQQILGTQVEGLCEGSGDELRSVSTLPSLSSYQENIVKLAMQRQLTLIQGPAGCGKTTTMLNIVYQLARQNKGPLLVCAQSNIVVDQLALSVEQMKLKVVRLFTEIRPSDNSTYHLSLDYLSSEFLKRESENCSEAAERPHEVRKMMADRTVLDDAEVICCTILSASDERLCSMKFHAILIDESMQATEPECMLPISLGCEKLVLVGDHLQLNPVIKSKKALECGLNRSLLQRLVASGGVQPLNLNCQYRMHPNLWLFPSTHNQGFWPSTSGVSASERKLADKTLPWPDLDFPFMFYNVKGVEVNMGSGTYKNREEVTKIEELVARLLERGIAPTRVGVVTQYVGQKDVLVERLKKFGVEVNMVDGFQGREKDIIIVSCVRSHGTTGVGSLGYMPRFHLVLTRAKFGLVIVGHAAALKNIEMWKNLLIFSRQHGVLVEGDLDRLKKCRVKL